MNLVPYHHAMHPHTPLQLVLTALLLISCISLAQEGPINNKDVSPPVPPPLSSTVVPGTVRSESLAPYPPPLPAAVLPGRVTDASGAEVRLVLTGHQLPSEGDSRLRKIFDASIPFTCPEIPSAGDKVDFYFKIPGIDDDVAVGSGTVLSADDVSTVVKFEQGTGRPQPGHLTRIHSQTPRWSQAGLSVYHAFMLMFACKNYAAEYSRHPQTLEALGRHPSLNPRDIDFLHDARFLRCPMLKDDTQIGYEMLQIQNDGPGVQILFRSKAVSSKGHRVVAYTDGTVKLVSDGAAPANSTPPSPVPSVPASPGSPPTTQSSFAESMQGAMAAAQKENVISYLGLLAENVPMEMIRALQLRPRSGAQIIGVWPGSPAALAGLQKDDIVSEIDGSILREGDIDRIIFTKPPGTKLKFAVSRNLRVQIKEVTLMPPLDDGTYDDLLRSQAEAGDAAAQLVHGIRIIKKGIPALEQEGMTSITRAAQQELRLAQFILAGLYYAKTGDTEAQAKGIEWFRRAAALGVADAQALLAGLYYEKQDFQQAMQYARLAADQGHESGDMIMGFMLLNGQGTAQDLVEGARRMMLAAEAGIKEAVSVMGELHEKGLGVPQNLATAKEWYQKASALGEPEATEALQRLSPSATGTSPPPMTSQPPQAQPLAATSSNNPGSFAGTFKGEVTLVDGSTNGAAVTPGGPCPATFIIRQDPSGTVWGLDIRSDRSKPNASQLDGHWSLKAGGNTLSSGYDLPAGSENISIEVIGDKLKGIIFSQNRRDGAITRSSSYSFRATRVR